MPTYAQLYHLNLRPLKQSQEQWAAAAKRLKAIHSSYRITVTRNFGQADWASSGPDPASAETQVNGVLSRLGDAAAQAEGNAEVLGGAYRELRSEKRELQRLTDEVAPGMELFVQKNGTVVLRKTVDDHPAAHNDPEAEGARQQENKQVEQLAADLSLVLRRAAEIDATTAWALRYNAGDSKARHNDVVVSGLDDARQHV